MAPLIHTELVHMDLEIDAEWDNMCDIVPDKIEVKKVLEEWTSDEEDSSTEDGSMDLAIMEVDEQIGSNFLADDIFGYDCGTPACPQEELLGMSLQGDGTPPLRPEHSFSALPPIADERHQEAFKKLAESMKKSQETRKCLTMKTEKATESYERRSNIRDVMSSVDKSTKQLHGLFGNLYQSV